ncbi:MAG TPA: membrane protein insertase YidC [Herpetosiphonaceae bacterium]|nr:membrane protein insertase YidC [Herpetosiphonaceae bacterium]
MSFIVTPLIAVLEWLFSLTGNLGWAIVVFTVLVRIAMLPLTIKQLQSQKKQQILQPKLREIQRKYGKDREKVTQETLKLYKQHGANPASGCLPLLITLPILLGVWQAVTKFPTAGLTAQQLSFFWIPNLTAKDPTFIMPILAVVLQFITAQMAIPRNPDPSQAQMYRITAFMPLVFGFVYFNFPAGAVLYSVVGSLIQMVQQYFTTGFGSLPKYLPFLPEKTGFLTQPVVTEVEIDGDGEPVEEAPRRDFWTALAKLDAPQGATAEAGDSGDSATEAAIEEVRATMTRRPPKRSRRRGSKPDSIGG